MNSDPAKLDKRALTHLSRTECQSIYPQIFHNANRNWQAASLLAENSFFGQAIALATVSIEEAIKALVIQLDSNGFNFRSAKGVSRFFNEHKIRHLTACIFLGMDIIGEDLIAYLEKLKKDPKALPLLQEQAKDMEALAIQAISYFSEKAKEIKTELPFFLNIEQSRQRGFYCDFENSLVSPDDITQGQYLITAAKFNRIHQFIKGFSEALSSQPEQERHQLHKTFKDGELYLHLGNLLQGSRTDALFSSLLQALGDLENINPDITSKFPGTTP